MMSSALLLRGALYSVCYSLHCHLVLSLALRLCCSSSPFACPGYRRAIDLCKEYAKTKGPARKIRPENHSFFKKLAPKIRVMLEKCERENGFMWVSCVFGAFWVWLCDIRFAALLCVLQISPQGSRWPSWARTEGNIWTCQPKWSPYAKSKSTVVSTVLCCISYPRDQCWGPSKFSM
jgi:hypothetical protein